MTDAEKAAIAEHLATKVCGYERMGSCYYKDHKLIDAVTAFEPLTDADDTALVMEAWRKKGNGLSIDMDAYAQVRPWTVMTNHGDTEGACSDAHETMAEAVCVAIYRSSREGARS